MTAHLTHSNTDNFTTSRQPGSEWESLVGDGEGLVNPASGLANDYLNHFNEILLLIENLPVLLPEMVDELITWQPQTYESYFHASALPGSAVAIRIYRNLDKAFVRKFEACICSLDALAEKSVALISSQRTPDGEIRSEDVELFCEEMSAKIRGILAIASDLVNHGIRNPPESPQTMADRILSEPMPASAIV